MSDLYTELSPIFTQENIPTPLTYYLPLLLYAKECGTIIAAEPRERLMGGPWGKFRARPSPWRFIQGEPKARLPKGELQETRETQGRIPAMEESAIGRNRM